jgi:tRNA U34 5-carboxymethylaminomethyl modifying GTPase MnmE/TrmE
VTSTGETIAAVATPRGPGGISVVRLSGPDALALAAARAPPWADVVRSGASTIPMRESNL